MSDPLWIFYHLPKSGGTTLKAHLEKHLVWDDELVDFSNWGVSYRTAHGRPEFADRSPEQRARARVLAGHKVDFGIHRLVPDREPRYFTFIRDPAERCVSLYNFRRSRGETSLEFKGWYETVFLPHQRNGIARFYAERLLGKGLHDRPAEHLGLAKELLDRCWLVSATDRLDAEMAILCDAIGIPRGWQTLRSADSTSTLTSATHPERGERISRFFTLTDDWRDRIRSDSPSDMDLIDYAGKIAR